MSNPAFPVFGTLLLLCVSGGSNWMGTEEASVVVTPAFLEVEDLTVVPELLFAEGTPCRASLNACISAGLCKSTENPCFCKKNSELGISARYRTALSH